MTLPLTGLYTSEAALTDSTTAHASPAFKTRPISGTSTNTKSPSALCACSETPISTVPSGAVRTHSWLLAYRKSLGILLNVIPRGLSWNQYLSVTHERRFDDA